MPSTNAHTVTLVDFTREELNDYIASHMTELQSSDGSVQMGQRPGVAMVLSFALPPAKVDQVLRALVQNLPPVGQYVAIPSPDPNQPDIAMRVRWINK